MMDVYIKARRGGVRFAVPASDVGKILSEPVAIPVPDAPEGICGIVYDEGTILPVRTLDPARRRPSQLVILCTPGAGRTAYAADRVETMEPLNRAELETALPIGDGGILLLCKEGTA